MNSTPTYVKRAQFVQGDDPQGSNKFDPYV